MTQIQIIQYWTDSQRMYHYIGFCEFSFYNNDENACLPSTVIYVLKGRPKYSNGILQISPSRCIILLNIYFTSLHVSGIRVSIIRRKLLYLCDTGICHCISATLVFVTLCGCAWSTGWNEIFIPTSRPDAIHTEWQLPVSHRYSNFLMMMGTRLSETCR